MTSYHHHPAYPYAHTSSPNYLPSHQLQLGLAGLRRHATDLEPALSASRPTCMTSKVNSLVLPFCQHDTQPIFCNSSISTTSSPNFHSSATSSPKSPPLNAHNNNTSTPEAPPLPRPHASCPPRSHTPSCTSCSTTPLLSRIWCTTCTSAPSRCSSAHSMAARCAWADKGEGGGLWWHRRFYA